MPNARRGEVWLVDLGMTAKVRPAVICNVPFRDDERAYEFDSSFRIRSPDGFPWPHQVPVEWMSNFPEVRILLGAEQLTVKELSADELKRLEEAVDKVKEANKQTEALEGEVYSAEAIFRSRNRALIQAKKANSNYRCEVCQFNFEETYGVIGREYIVAHHLKAIADGPSKTTLDDIALVCANCHAMIHVKNPPISIEELRKLVTHH
jgi:predicted HNH restriction endonuclease